MQGNTAMTAVNVRSDQSATTYFSPSPQRIDENQQNGNTPGFANGRNSIFCNSGEHFFPTSRSVSEK